MDLLYNPSTFFQTDFFFYPAAEARSNTGNFFHELGFMSVFVLKWMVLVWRGEFSRWKDGMCAKEGNHGMFLKIIFHFKNKMESWQGGDIEGESRTLS